MDEKLTENQLDVLCVLWNQAYDFLDLCEETDHFVWPTTDLRCVPDSILHDIKVNPEDDKSRPPWEVGTEDLFLQTLYEDRRSTLPAARADARPHMSGRAISSSGSWASATS